MGCEYPVYWFQDRDIQDLLRIKEGSIAAFVLYAWFVQCIQHGDKNVKSSTWLLSRMLSLAASSICATLYLYRDPHGVV